MRILFLCLMFVSCAVFASESALNDVNLQLKWRHQFQFAGYYTAIEKGLYKDHGLNVILHERLPGPSPIDRLASGHADYAIAGVGALLYRNNGVPLVALSATFHQSPSVLISRYSDIAALQNKKIMLTKGLMNAEITAMLIKGGVDLDSIELVPSNQSITGFINSEIDAYNAYTTNESYQLKQANIPYYSFYPKDFGIDFYGDVLLTTEQNIAQNVTQVQAFKEASLQGWEYAINNVDEIVELILRKYNTQEKTKAQLTNEANALIKLIYPELVPIGYMNERRWFSIGKILKNAHGSPVKDMNLDGFIFDSYVEESLFSVVKKNYKVLFVSITILVLLIIVLHNFRLKQVVKYRTKELDHAKAQAELEARTDPLTRLANRRSFIENIHHDLAIAKRNKLSFSIISLDIDFFKKVNDVYGHAAGDAALVTLSDIISHNIRVSDRASRVGGEEFVVTCLEKDQHDAIALAERIREEVAASTFSYKEQTFPLTISIGVAMVEYNESVDEALRKSDSALYLAKEMGRNNVQMFNAKGTMN